MAGVKPGFSYSNEPTDIEHVPQKYNNARKLKARKLHKLTGREENDGPPFIRGTFPASILLHSFLPNHLTLGRYLQERILDCT